MRITDTWLNTKAKPRKERYDVHTELKGLVVRVHPSGAVSFRIRYKRGKDANGRPLAHVLVLGEYGKDGLSLADAHEWQRKCQRWLTLGLDPIEEKAKEEAARESARRERSEAGTVRDVVEQFIHRKLRAERWAGESWVRDPKTKTKARKRPDAAAALLGLFDGDPPKNAKPSLVSEYGELKAQDLSKRQLIALLDGIVDRGAPISANRVHALLVQLFNWAAAKDLIPASPVAGIERPGGDESPRDRVLTGKEIKTFWAKLAEADMGEPTRLALKLLLVTAQRRGEITLAEWSHFDLEAKRWTIPVTLLKSAHSRRGTPEPHVVPLSPLAVKLLKQLKALTGEKPYVLPGQKGGPYTERVLSRAVRDNEKHFGIPHFTPHDLRRTAASHMTRLGVPRLHVEKVLNHSTGDIAEVYDRHDYLPEKKAALEKWATHLEEIIAGKEQTVIPLARSA